MANRKRINPTAPYFVQMREQERRLILSTLEVARQALPTKAKFSTRLQMAATLLGVEPAYLRVRGRVLGGILEGDPKHEPPIVTTTQAWLRPKAVKAPQPPQLVRHPKLTIVPNPESEPEPEPELEDENAEPDPRNAEPLDA
jgi:hypothetical protein